MSRREALRARIEDLFRERCSNLEGIDLTPWDTDLQKREEQFPGYSNIVDDEHGRDYDELVCSECADGFVSLVKKLCQQKDVDRFLVKYKNLSFDQKPMNGAVATILSVEMEVEARPEFGTPSWG